MTNEEILILKIGELTLHRDMVDTAIRRTLRGVRQAGLSRYQCMVLIEDLRELERRADDANKVVWPVLPKQPISVS